MGNKFKRLKAHTKHRENYKQKQQEKLVGENGVQSSNRPGMHPDWMIKPIDRLTVVCKHSNEEYFRYVCYALACLCDHKETELEKDFMERMERINKEFIVMDLWAGTLVVVKGNLPEQAIKDEELIKLTQNLYMSKTLKLFVTAYNLGKTVTVYEDRGIVFE
jgi:hypothetical protein